MKDELLDETEMYPYNDEEKGTSFMCPAATSYDNYLVHIDLTLTTESPIAFGLHPNAEIDFRTTQSNRILSTILDLQDRVVSGGEGTLSPDEVAKESLQAMLDLYQEKKFDTEDIIRSLEEQGPYQNVFIQEMDVMNNLLSEICRSLIELRLGLAGELTISDAMDNLKNSIYLDRVPLTWKKISWPSLRGLQSWLNDFNSRLTQLEEWQNNPADIPKVFYLLSIFLKFFKFVFYCFTIFDIIIQTKICNPNPL
jgi:dynein heavy chain